MEGGLKRGTERIRLLYTIDSPSCLRGSLAFVALGSK